MPKIIKVGCCGWAEAHQKYFKDFAILEIQETFYNLGEISKYQKWRKEAPENFEFILKSPQLITHLASSPTYRKLKEKIPESKRKNYGFFQPTQEVFKTWEETKKVTDALGVKIIIFQCPASFKPEKENVENLRKFFKRIGDGNFIYAWEPRGEWPQDLIKKLCKELNLVHCVDPFKQKSVFGEINYFRLHGRDGYNLKYKYTIQDLLQLKKFCDRDINYVMFNNVFMLENGKEFRKIIK